MPRVSYTQTVTGIGDNLSQAREVSDSASIDVDESIPDSSTDLQINIAIDVSEVSFLAIKSDQDITIETNSGSAAADTLTISGGVPLIYSGTAGETFFLGTDVTAIFVTNASGAAARLQIKGLQDATP